MFKRRTLFVVGAGTSYEAGLPVGADLAKTIAAKLTIQTDSFGSPSAASDKEFFAPFYRSYRQQIRDYIAAFHKIRDGILFSNSIDDFLNIHSDDARTVEVGKAAIVRAVLEAETKSKLFVDPRSSDSSITASGLLDTWYVKLMRVLGPGISAANVHAVLENVSFIVFNYDRCIEYFLKHAIHHLYAVPLSEADEIVRAATIIHPYGSIGDLRHLPFGGYPHRDHNFILLSKGIKTYTEQIEDTETVESIARAVRSSESIVFLGFAFHNQNVTLLKPPKPQYGKIVFATALGMSDSDKSEVKAQLSDSFPDNEKRESSVSLNYHINIENKLTCAGLFDYYAKSIAG